MKIANNVLELVGSTPMLKNEIYSTRMYGTNHIIINETIMCGTSNFRFDTIVNGGVGHN